MTNITSWKQQQHRCHSKIFPAQYCIFSPGRTLHQKLQNPTHFVTMHAHSHNNNNFVWKKYNFNLHILALSSSITHWPTAQSHTNITNTTHNTDTQPHTHTHTFTHSPRGHTWCAVHGTLKWWRIRRWPRHSLCLSCFHELTELPLAQGLSCRSVVVFGRARLIQDLVLQKKKKNRNKKMGEMCKLLLSSALYLCAVHYQDKPAFSCCYTYMLISRVVDGSVVTGNTIITTVV